MDLPPRFVVKYGKIGFVSSKSLYMDKNSQNSHLGFGLIDSIKL